MLIVLGTTLMLLTAIGGCAYELYQASLSQEIDNSQYYGSLQKDKSDTVINVPIEALEAYYQDLGTVLLEIGYLYPHTVKARMEKFRRLYNKANLNQDEVSMLRGILRQIKWAMSNSQ